MSGFPGAGISGGSGTDFMSMVPMVASGNVSVTGSGIITAILAVGVTNSGTSAQITAVVDGVTLFNNDGIASSSAVYPKIGMIPFQESFSVTFTTTGGSSMRVMYLLA